MKIKEKMNIYVCEYGCHNITVDVDKGVTPFIIDCRREGDTDRPLDPAKSKDGVCTGQARSCMYPAVFADGMAYPVPTLEWYEPKRHERIGLSDGEKEHLSQGGLLLRKRTDSPMMLHEY